MAVALVEGLELVEAADQQREWPIVLAGALDLLRQPLVQVAMVVETGETVGDGVELGAGESRRGGLEHRREGLRHVAAQALHLGAAHPGRRDVGLDDRDDRAVLVAHGRKPGHPDAPLIDVEHVDVRRDTGEALEQLVVGEDLAAQRRVFLGRLLGIDDDGALGIVVDDHRGEEPHLGVIVTDGAQRGRDMQVLGAALVEKYS